MPKVPEKCTRCGAPISWEEGATVVKCEFCGYKNNLKDDFLSLFKNYLKLRDPKKIIRNPFSLILVLPVIFLFLILNSPIKKQEKIKAEYWPTDWSKLKTSKYPSNKIFNPSSWSSRLKESHTVKFMPSMIENCKYKNSLEKELEKLKLKKQKSLYEFNIRVGNIGQFDDYYGISERHSLSHTKAKYSSSDRYADFQETERNYNFINEKILIKDKKTYEEHYAYMYDNVFLKETEELNKLIFFTGNKIFASYLEALRQTGDKNWKLYSRWGWLWGIGDLYRFHERRYEKSKEYKKISFDNWLLKKRILDDSHFRDVPKLYGGSFKLLKYKSPEEDKINKVCEAFKD
tara:strand:- start:96 stop:1133 length:1038 start_codon:yes stop_codon:yes gene_type:complete